MNGITYADKVALNEDASINDINKVTANNMNEIKSVVNSLANLFFPIKKIIIFNDNDDHSDYLGFTWQRIASGRMLVGINTSDTDFNTIGKTGGEKTHTLTIDEIPSHNHDIIVDKAGVDVGASLSGFDLLAQNLKYVDRNAVRPTGGGEAHNNLPPYQVVAYWQRIS